MLHSFPVAALHCMYKVPYTDGSKIRDVLFHHSISITKSRPRMAGQCYVVRPLKGRFLPCRLASLAADNPDNALQVHHLHPILFPLPWVLSHLPSVLWPSFPFSYENTDPQTRVQTDPAQPHLNLPWKALYPNKIAFFEEYCLAQQRHHQAFPSFVNQHSNQRNLSCSCTVS